MPLTSCPVCNNHCSNLAVSCPNCGHPLVTIKGIANPTKKHKFFNLKSQIKKSKTRLISFAIIGLITIGVVSFVIYQTAEYIRKPKCPLTINQSPVIHGIKLRMSRDEVKSLFPKLLIPNGDIINIEGSQSPKLSDDIEKVQITFENNLVKIISIDYKDRGWRSLKQFSDEIFIKFNLPYAEEKQSERSIDTAMSREIRCKDFTVFAGGLYFDKFLKSNFHLYLYDTKTQEE